jgi:hypothetical protein
VLPVARHVRCTRARKGERPCARGIGRAALNAS